MMKKIIIISLACLLFSWFTAAPVLAQCLYACCSLDQCQGPHPEGDYECGTDFFCCESCVAAPLSTPTAAAAPQEKEEGGIINPVLPQLGRGEGEAVLGYLLSTFLKLALVAAGLLCLVFLIWGGFDWLTSSGDKGQLTMAKQRIVNALIGLLLVLAAWAIIAILDHLFGLSLVTGPIRLPSP